MLGRVGGVPWDSLLSFPIDWEAGLKCAQVIIVIMMTMTMIMRILIDFQIHCHPYKCLVLRGPHVLPQTHPSTLAINLDPMYKGMHACLINLQRAHQT